MKFVSVLVSPPYSHLAGEGQIEKGNSVAIYGSHQYGNNPKCVLGSGQHILSHFYPTLPGQQVFLSDPYFPLSFKWLPSPLSHLAHSGLEIQLR